MELSAIGIGIDKMELTPCLASTRVIFRTVLIFLLRHTPDATVSLLWFILVLPPVHQPGGTWMNLVSTGMNRDDP